MSSIAEQKGESKESVKWKENNRNYSIEQWQESKSKNKQREPPRPMTKDATLSSRELPEREEKEGRVEKIVKEIIIDTLPNTVKDINLHTQEAG